MKIVFNKKNGMLVIQLRDEPSVESAEIGPGLVVDYNDKQEIVSIEIEDAHKFDLSKFSFETLEKVG